eukprot:5301605-Amphidinium_carterae.1
MEHKARSRSPGPWQLFSWRYFPQRGQSKKEANTKDFCPKPETPSPNSRDCKNPAFGKPRFCPQ